MTTLTGFKKTLAILTRSKSIVGLVVLTGATVLLSFYGKLETDTRGVLEMIGLSFFGSRAIDNFQTAKTQQTEKSEP